MTKKVNFLFGIHCHQPVGNFEHVFEQAYKDCYLPFIKVMDRHPRIKFTVHYSGILYDWFLKNHPEFIELIARLVQRGQVEILSSGYYEPIIPIIPDEDKIGQITMQNQFIQKHFKTTPAGLWLTERIWEPNLPKILSKSGIEFVMVDDYHFISAGVEKEKLLGYYISEEEGFTLKVFPISKNLRYLVPFKLPQETIDYLASIATPFGDSAAILADDGEKFGLWPGTYKWVYEDGYLENLLKAIEENLSWIRPMKFSEYIEEFPAVSRAYLPTASYFEMMEWSLPYQSGVKLEKITEELKKSNKFEEYSQFFRGGFFRNFFVKYNESNYMHKKMLLISQKIQTLKKNNTSEDRKKLIAEAEKNLYKAQCNCGYWHGVFGGLYLSNLRHAIYEHLIRAENILQKLQRGDKKYTELLVADIDKDGNEEVILSNPYLNLYSAPSRGGSVFEIDYKPKEFNILNVLTRRREIYHNKILDQASYNQAVSSGTKSIHETNQTKENNIEKFLIYDKRQRMSLLDHFLMPDFDAGAIKNSNYIEISDFADARYDFYPARKNDEVTLNLSRTGFVFGQEVKIMKSISLLSGQSIIMVDYEILNQSDKKIEVCFGVEFNLTLLAGNSPDRYYKIHEISVQNFPLNSEGLVSGIRHINLVDEWKGFSVSFESKTPFDFIRYPIETVSQSEGGVERTYQGSCLFFIYKLVLDPKSAWKNKLVVRFED